MGSLILYFTCLKLIRFKNLAKENVKMPKQIQEIKDFLLTARRKDAKSVKIKKNKGAMQPLLVHAGGSRPRKGGEAEAVSHSRTRRQGAEVEEKRGKIDFKITQNTFGRNALSFEPTCPVS